MGVRQHYVALSTTAYIIGGAEYHSFRHKEAWGLEAEIVCGAVGLFCRFVATYSQGGNMPYKVIMLRS